MRLVFLFVFSSICSSGVFASTIIEMEAAGGIASTLQETVQSQPANLIQGARETVQKHEETQNRRLANIEAVNLGLEAPSPSQTEQKSPPFSSSPSVDRSGKAAPFSTEGTSPAQDKKIHQKVESVDYNRNIQVFYKRGCEPSQKNCHRGAVLTNIKSLIFDYAHRRGSFSKIEK